MIPTVGDSGILKAKGSVIPLVVICHLIPVELPEDEVGGVADGNGDLHRRE